LISLAFSQSHPDKAASELYSCNVWLSPVSLPRDRGICSFKEKTVAIIIITWDGTQCQKVSIVINVKILNYYGGNQEDEQKKRERRKSFVWHG
jgi:hypothetical protein